MLSIVLDTILIFSVIALTLVYITQKKSHFFISPNGKVNRKEKNNLDALLDSNLLHLKSDGSYQKYMNEMLQKNAEFEFKPVSTYKDFREQLFISLGGDIKYFKDYETIVLMLLFVSNKYFLQSAWLFPQFIISVVRVKFNKLGEMKNTMHLLTLHATSIGGYLSASLDDEFITVLKKVRIVRENTGYYDGKKVMFARVKNPFLGSKVCPLSGKHKRIKFPPLTKDHEYLHLKNYGNALGVHRTRTDAHYIDDTPLMEHDMMKIEDYWKLHFPEEMKYL